MHRRLLALDGLPAIAATGAPCWRVLTALRGACRLRDADLAVAIGVEALESALTSASAGGDAGFRARIIAVNSVWLRLPL